MRASVRGAFVPFSAALEGVVRWMYLDVKGLVTVGIGNLIDSMESALALPFVRRDGRRDGTPATATREEIAAEWRAVKAHATASRQGHRVLEAVTSLRLTDDGVRQVVEWRLELNETILRHTYRCTLHEDCRLTPALGEACDVYGYDAWPADVQLASHSMAWACGPAFGGTHRGGFPRLAAALRARDWMAAARECQMGIAGNPGLIPRNAANRALYLAAIDGEADEVSWDVLTAIDARLWPARPREPSVVTPAQLLEEPAIVRPRIDLVPPARDDR